MSAPSGRTPPPRRQGSASARRSAPELDLPPEPIEIAAGPIKLRPWEERLAPDLLAGMSDPELLRYALRPPPTDLDAAREWIADTKQRWRDGKNLGLAVHDAVTGELLGDVSLGYLDPLFRLANIGYWTMPAARGRGVASRAVAVLTRWGFQALGLHRIELGHAVGNVGSCRVAVQNGFRPEGVAGVPAATRRRLGRQRDARAARRRSGALPLTRGLRQALSRVIVVMSGR